MGSSSHVLGFADPSGDTDPSPPHRVGRFDRWLVRKILTGLGEPPMNITLWDGVPISGSGGHPIGTLTISDRSTLWRIVQGGELALGDAYADGRMTVEGDMVPLLEHVYRASTEWAFLPRWLRQSPRFRRNTPDGSKENIHHHYDLGNEFYRLWLDEELLYTCAYFPSPEASLEEAQRAKMDHVCRKVRLCAGERVVEAGCGWGSLALHMARHYGVTVRAFNISHEQIAFARERARHLGLDDRVEFIEDDYRNIDGKYDVFMSVGMLEHVGPDHYRELGGVIDRCLEPEGRGLIHSIGRNQPRPPSVWIERRIFPGAYMPPIKEMLDVLEPYDLSVLDVENLRLHYARTLQHWLDRFEKSAEKVEHMFDARFVRAWRIYLSGSIAAFLTGATQLFQIVFARGENNEIPWTRDDIYRTG
jgi:cyclopropane-fatty-acyl-phospholipid synthase